MTVPNSDTGFDELVGRVNGHSLVWAIEGTGTFGRALADRLLADGGEVREVPTRLTGRLRSRGGFSKTDRGDAAAIGRAALSETLPVVSHLPVTEALRVLIRQREALVNTQVRALNRIRARLRELDPDMERSMGRLRTKSVLETLATYRDPGSGDPYWCALMRVIGLDAINSLTRRHQIRQLETEIKAVLPEAGQVLTEICGIGLIGAGTIIAATGDVDRFPTEGHYGRYCGTAPLDASSGRQERHRVNRWGNRALNRVLHTAIITQLQQRGDAHTYIEKRLTEGKPKNVAIRAAKRHLNKKIYRLLKNHPLT
jgi:transposase